MDVRTVARVMQLLEDQDALASWEQLVRLGVPPATITRYVQRGSWQQPLPRVYGPAGVPLNWRRAARASLLSLGEDAWLTRQSAAAAHGMWRAAEAFPIEVLVPYGREAHLSATWLRPPHRSRTIDHDQGTLIDGLRVTSVARTIVDLSAQATKSDLRDLVIDTVRRSLTTPSDLLEACERAGRLRGVAGVRQALASLDPQTVRARSNRELDVLAVFVEAGLPTPVVNHPVPDERTGKQYEIDFAYPWWQLGYEYDSDRHHSLPGELHRDRRRDRRLRQLGWDLRHLSNSDLASPRTLAREIWEDIRHAQVSTGIAVPPTHV